MGPVKSFIGRRNAGHGVKHQPLIKNQVRTCMPEERLLHTADSRPNISVLYNQMDAVV